MNHTLVSVNKILYALLFLMSLVFFCLLNSFRFNFHQTPVFVPFIGMRRWGQGLTQAISTLNPVTFPATTTISSIKVNVGTQNVGQVLKIIFFFPIPINSLVWKVWQHKLAWTNRYGQFNWNHMVWRFSSLYFSFDIFLDFYGCLIGTDWI